AEGFEVAVLLLAQLLHRESAHRPEVSALRVTGVLGGVAIGDLPDIRAVIAALGNHGGAAEALQEPGLDAAGQVCDLRPRIVVVKLARDLPAGPLQQRRDRVAERGLAPMADM